MQLVGPMLSDDHTPSPTEGLPDGLGGERREGVEDDQEVLEGFLEEGDVLEDLLGFEEPVSVFVPDGVVEEFIGLGEAVMFDQAGGFADGEIEFADDPIFAHVVGADFAPVHIGGGKFSAVDGVAGFVDEVLDEAGDVPKLIAEVAAGNDGGFGEGLVLAGGTVGDDTEAEGVGAVFDHHVHGVDDVAFGFAHFLAVGVEDEAVEVDVAEGDLVGAIEAEHDHAGDPRKEDVGAGFHDAEGVEGAFGSEVIGGDEGPLAAGEPSVEGVLVADIGVAAALELFFVDLGGEYPVGGVVDVDEGRDGDAPRDLAGNIPVFELLEIVNENALFASGVEFDFAVLDGLDGAVGEGFDVDEPLLFEEGFDDAAAFVAVADRMLDSLFAATETELLKILEDLGASVSGGEVFVGGAGGGGHGAIEVDDGDLLEMVTLTDVEVVLVVGRGDLDGAGAEVAVDVGVGDNGDGAVGEGEAEFMADEMFVTGVVGMDGDGGVAEHGFGTSSGDDDFSEVADGVDEGVGDVPEGASFVLVIDFDVGEGGLVLGAEVDQAFTTVDQLVVQEVLEGVVDGVDDLGIEGEGEVGPVAGGAEGAELELHIPSLLGDEVPDLGVKLVARVVEAGVAGLLEGFLVDDPSLEASVVGARDIPGRVTSEAMITDESVLDGDGEAVADVEVAVGVGRRHDDGVGLVVGGLVVGLEGAGAFPERVDFGLKLSRFV